MQLHLRLQSVLVRARSRRLSLPHSSGKKLIYDIFLDLTLIRFFLFLVAFGDASRSSQRIFESFAT